MSLFAIALRSIKQRSLASVLTCFSMALGVSLMVAVITIHGVVQDSFRVGEQLGFNILVGPKGGKLQLTLNSVYYLDQPIENIPYAYYLEFKQQADRQADYRHSLANKADQLHWELTDATQQLAELGAGSGSAGLLTGAALELLQQQAEQQDPGQRDGRYGPYIELAIPLLLGDYYESFRVVGTTPDLFGTLKIGPSADQSYEFSEGRNFKAFDQTNGYFEAVVGSIVARQANVSVGDKINPRHGAVDGHIHNEPFTVVGILAPTGTPNDRAVFVNMDGFYLMADHAKPVEETPEDERENQLVEPADEDLAAGAGEFDIRTPLPIEQREVTAILLRVGGDDPISQLFAVTLPNEINEGSVAQAVYPIQEIHKFFGTFIGPVLILLLVITLMICVVSGISILVTIYNSMNDRRQEIAVLRALGAGRSTVLWIILLESMILSVVGGAIGWLLGHGLVTMASALWVEARTGVTIGFFQFAPPIADWLPISLELLLVPLLICLAIVVGLIPAIAAYRTDVAKSLGK